MWTEELYLDVREASHLSCLLSQNIFLFIIIYSGYNIIYSYISYEQWKTLLLIVISTGTVALFIYYYGLKKLPASHTTLFELFWPLSAVMIDWIIIGNPLSIPQLYGAVILLVSMTVLTQEKSNERP